MNKTFVPLSEIAGRILPAAAAAAAAAYSTISIIFWQLISLWSQATSKLNLQPQANGRALSIGGTTKPNRGNADSVGPIHHTFTILKD